MTAPSFLETKKPKRVSSTAFEPRTCERCRKPYHHKPHGGTYAQWIERRFCSKTCQARHNANALEAVRGVDVAKFIDVPRSDKWQQRAACRDLDTEIFFPITRENADARQAKATCVTCPVRSECLAWALTRGEDYGIWGGLSEEERRALKESWAR